MKYILAIDQGTTSTRAILFTKDGQPFQTGQKEVECLYPKSGWVETDALSIWISVLDVINEVTVKANITLDDVDSIGITNQRETTVVWDKKTGLPVAPAIVWQSRQSAEICDKLIEKKEFIHNDLVILSPYYFVGFIQIENLFFDYISAEGILCTILMSNIILAGIVHARRRPFDFLVTLGIFQSLSKV